MNHITDVIDHLVGIETGSPADALRTRRPVTKEHAQKSWAALFEPSDVSQASLAERFAIAAFVSALHGQPQIADFYGERLAAVENGSVLLSAVTALAEINAAQGPYGHYPDGPLTKENTDGPLLQIGATDRAVLGERLSAALEHAHLLTFHPRDASTESLQTLLSAGWSTTGVVTLSQLVSFLAFHIRVIAGLKVMAAA
jgi:CMD domain protein